MTQRLVPLVIAVAIGVVAGYGLRPSDEADGQGLVVSAAKPAGLEKCPASAWARGGGFNYARAGMTCRQVNRFVRNFGVPARKTKVGRAYMFRGWVCGQRSKTAAPYSPLLNVCADGTRKMRFLMAG